MAVKLGRLKSNSNVAILNAIRNGASLDYQRRIPVATKGNISQTLGELRRFRPQWNEFENALINRIGTVYARNMVWQNPLAEFKRGLLNDGGDTIEEIYTGLIESHVYDPNRDYMERTIFGTHDIDVRSSFHHVNRREFYPVTVNEEMLKNAFLGSEGLSSFVSQVMAAPTTSDNWDEFLATTSLFAEYEKNDGFWHVNVPNLSDLTSDAPDARKAVKTIRALIDTIKFPSTRYNSAGMPSFANPDEIIIFATPQFKAAMDVDALAAAFNEDRMSIDSRIIVIPKENFGIDQCQAILTVREFFVLADQALDTTSQFNPVSRGTNYFLHHWEVISASRFVPAVMFWTGKDDTITPVTITPVIGELSVVDPDGAVQAKVDPGANYDVKVPVTGADGYRISLTYSCEGAMSQRTTVTPQGVLVVGYDERATTIKVNVKLAYVNPDSSKAQATNIVKSFNVTVNKDNAVDDWPGGRDTTEAPDPGTK